MIWLLSSIWIAAALAIGLDHSRLIATEQFFPFNLYIDGSFIWVLMSIMVIPVFIPGLIKKNYWVSKILLTANLFCFLAWSFICYFLSENSRGYLNTDLMQYVPIAQIVFGSLGLVLCGYFREKIILFKGYRKEKLNG